MAAEVEAQRYREAERLLDTAVATTNRRYPHLEDEDITRTLRIAQKYQESLRKYSQEATRKDRP
ncbi:MAG: hypothetical protein LC795_18385 [Acidobacteria bacterium]|nr:hypothetical protein [Acidobacteriota bacterium]MCA1621232.1 hypothetical protein [Acidobacteriota bacterium]